MKNLHCRNLTTGHQMTNFCAWYDSCAVVPCAKFCSNYCIGMWMSAKWKSQRIWIAMKNCKMDPWSVMLRIESPREESCGVTILLVWIPREIREKPHNLRGTRAARQTHLTWEFQWWFLLILDNCVSKRGSWCHLKQVHLYATLVLHMVWRIFEWAFHDEAANDTGL